MYTPCKSSIFQHNPHRNAHGKLVNCLPSRQQVTATLTLSCSQPPYTVKLILEAVCIILGQQPKYVDGGPRTHHQPRVNNVSFVQMESYHTIADAGDFFGLGSSLCNYFLIAWFVVHLFWY